ncbi:MAG: SigE family RNA polymerase sigma factor [Geodermatophilaceae bacterium]
MDFDEYVARRGQGLLRFGYVLSGDAHLAEDLVQTALLKAHRSWRRVMLADQPDAYLRRVILNTYLDHRRRRSATEVPLDCDGSSWREGSSDDHAEGVVLRSEMWLALAELPRKQRAVLVLRYYEDCSDSAIAILLNCTESTVRSNASRALRALRGTWNYSDGSPLEGKRHD